MILYLDTSSLVKLYLEEAHSELVREWVGAAEAIATSRVAYPEALSAFARRRAHGDLESSAFETLRRSFDSDWPTFVLLPLQEQKAGSLAVRHLIRGFDAVHLAAASDLRSALPDDSVIFSSFDRKLLQAARDEGVPVLMPAAEDLG
ncbi:MAG TPA: type II toxin-antitoxin system VapC family toxin [Thermoanaerobaculia bacterium]|nr:type II toxin-antitoxin system VapC family toxin [Thermoanaerobaculia bacterium]